MNRLSADWHVLRGALGVFAICALLALAILTLSNLFWREMQAEYQAHYTRFREVSTQYLAVDDEERIIAEQYPKFIELYQRGVIGDEHRLSWIEALTSAGTGLGLPQVEYVIDAQKNYVPEFALNTGTFNLNASDMALTLGLVHEGDLVRLFDTLDRTAEGLFTVQACTLNRQESPQAVSGVQANIRAECKLRWFTLDPAGAKVQL